MIFVLIGKSGAGKDTIMREMMNKNNSLLNPVSYTSRPMRENEVNGVDYNFVSKEIFIKMINNGKLLEYREYNTEFNGEAVTWYYGLPFDAFEKGKNYIAVLDFIGAKKLQDNMDDVHIIYIDATEDVRFERALLRDNIEDKADHRVLEIQIRMKTDDKDFLPKEIADRTSLILDNNSKEDLCKSVLKLSAFIETL
ncbi:MAG: hypothetical protein ACRCTZ_18785 [Sarcina sp.]